MTEQTSFNRTLDKAKISLWKLLRVNAENLTANEADVFFRLTKDEAIQNLLDEALEK